MRINRVLAVVIGLILCTGLISGCGETSVEKADGKLKIVCTAFPQYDWVKQLVGEKSSFDVKLLSENGGDMHNYQPTAEDIIKISSSDLFIYVGGASDIWVEDVLNGAVNKNMKAISLMDVLGESVKEEEIVAGMQNADGGEEDSTHSGKTEYDEHIWLSLRNAEVLVKAIAEALIESDGDNAEIYRGNCTAYLSELETLDLEYDEAVKSAARNTIMFCDRFPFRYMIEDYGLDYYAAFAGCSAETEASFETIAFLTDKADELELPVLLTVENSDGKIAEAVRNNSKNKNQQILVMNSLQSVTRKEIENGFSYISVMKDNLKTLETALN